MVVFANLVLCGPPCLVTVCVDAPTVPKRFFFPVLVTRFVRKRRAAVRIQTWWRGVRARELVKALKIKRKKMMEARLRKEKAERERMMKEKGESLMEDSFLAAQKELYAMAKDAESKASQAARGGGGGDVNLDSMFTMLADDTNKSDTDLQRVEADLDALLSNTTPGGTVSIRRGDGTRTIRRKRRIQKKVEEVRVVAPLPPGVLVLIDTRWHCLC